MTQIISKTDTLYERDYVAWCEDTAAKLRTRDLEHLDFENLIEEIESLGRSDRRELRNRLTVLLTHLLKRIYVNSPENFNGWEITINEQRRQIRDLLEESPSLKPYLVSILPKSKVNALGDVRIEYKKTIFLDQSLSNEINDILNKIYW
jgi:hypothetical protein